MITGDYCLSPDSNEKQVLKIELPMEFRCPEYGAGVPVNVNQNGSTWLAGCHNSLNLWTAEK